MEKKIVSAYFPDLNPTNQYTQNVRRDIRAGGITVLSPRLYIFPLKDFFACKIFNFNWVEDCMDIKTETKLKEILKYWRMCLFFDGLHLLGKKIVWTMHNKLPHEKEKAKYKIKLMKKLARRADAIVVHCGDSIPALREIEARVDTKKIHLINHPSYIVNYEKDESGDFKQRFHVQADECVFLFFGQIRKYKNIEILIAAFSSLHLPKAKLIIAGRASADYQKELRALIGGNEAIVLQPDFIPDEEIAAYYRTADIVVLPYDKESSLNSGAAYLSFSLKATVICPEIGTIKQLKDPSFVYAYDYTDSADHTARLAETIGRAYRDFERDHNVFREKGERAYRYMLEEHSDEKISAAYRALYEDLAYGKRKK